REDGSAHGDLADLELLRVEQEQARADVPRLGAGVEGDLDLRSLARPQLGERTLVDDCCGEGGTGGLHEFPELEGDGNVEFVRAGHRFLQRLLHENVTEVDRIGLTGEGLRHAGDPKLARRALFPGLRREPEDVFEFTRFGRLEDEVERVRLLLSDLSGARGNRERSPIEHVPPDLDGQALLSAVRHGDGDDLARSGQNLAEIEKVVRTLGTLRDLSAL